MNNQFTDRELITLLELLCVGSMLIGEKYTGKVKKDIIEIVRKIINSMRENDLSGIIKFRDDNTYDYDEDFKEIMFDKYIESAYAEGVQGVIMRLITNEIQDLLNTGEVIEDSEKLVLQLQEKYANEIYSNSCVNLKYIEPIKLPIRKAGKRNIKKNGNVIHAFEKSKK